MKLPVLLLAAANLCATGARAQTIHAVTELASQTSVVDGKVVGPQTEVVELSLKLAGITDYEVAVFPWARAYHMAQRDPYTLIYPIARTPEREKQFKWVGEVQKMHYHFVKLAERKDIVIKRLDDAKPYSVGVIRADVRHQYLLAHGFKNLLVAAKWNEHIPHLLNRRIDLLILGEYDLGGICAGLHVSCDTFERTTPLDELSMGLYMAYSLGTPDAIVERTRAAFDKLKAEGKVERIVKAKP